MAAIFKPFARLKIQGRSWGVLRSAVCLEVLGPGEIGSRPVVCGAGPQGTALARRGGVAALLCFLSSDSTIQFLLSSYSSSYSSSYLRFCWQGHKKQAFCESILKKQKHSLFFCDSQKAWFSWPCQQNRE